jgi:hypothetical protein
LSWEEFPLSHTYFTLVFACLSKGLSHFVVKGNEIPFVNKIPTEKLQKINFLEMIKNDHCRREFNMQYTSFNNKLMH